MICHCFKLVVCACCHICASNIRNGRTQIQPKMHSWCSIVIFIKYKKLGGTKSDQSKKKNKTNKEQAENLKEHSRSRKQQKSDLKTHNTLENTGNTLKKDCDEGTQGTTTNWQTMRVTDLRQNKTRLRCRARDLGWTAQRWRAGETDTSSGHPRG